MMFARMFIAFIITIIITEIIIVMSIKEEETTEERKTNGFGDKVRESVVGLMRKEFLRNKEFIFTEFFDPLKEKISESFGIYMDVMFFGIIICAILGIINLIVLLLLILGIIPMVRIGRN